MDNVKLQIKNDILVAEYTAIIGHFNTTVNFRIVVFGFYIAAICIIFPSMLTNWWGSLFILIFTIFIWILELRNRGLADSLLNRGYEIEKSRVWKSNLVNGIPFCQRSKYGSRGEPKKGDKKVGDDIRVFWFHFKNINVYKDLFLFTHTFIFDVSVTFFL